MARVCEEPIEQILHLCLLYFSVGEDVSVDSETSIVTLWISWSPCPIFRMALVVVTLVYKYLCKNIFIINTLKNCLFVFNTIIGQYITVRHFFWSFKNSKMSTLLSILWFLKLRNLLRLNTSLFSETKVFYKIIVFFQNSKNTLYLSKQVWCSIVCRTVNRKKYDLFPLSSTNVTEQQRTRSKRVCGTEKKA
jgi:hypothetical protein